MKGSISTRQKCAVCGGKLVHDDRHHGCFCPEHPKVGATKFIVRFPGGIYVNHVNYEAAAQQLNYLRHEKGVRQERFNPDDYRSAAPNSFESLAPKYLRRKEGRASYKDMARMINRAAQYFGRTNIREITGADVEDYLFAIPDISEKTRHNHGSQLSDFWKWCLARGNIITLAEMPIFPKIEFELGYRNTTDWHTQNQVIEKLAEHPNPKVVFGCDMLRTYTAIRPTDLRRMSEGSLSDDGWLTIQNPTKLKNKFKRIHLHPDHIAEWQRLQHLYPAHPEMLFFRHTAGNALAKADSPFGIRYLAKMWTNAAEAVGLFGVSLYPGTKHTTATETAKLLGREAAKKASGLSNIAFERYCVVEDNSAYQTVTAIREKMNGKVIELDSKKAI